MRFSKVAHLESSNAAMAEDLLAKTAIIEHYIMETKPGKLFLQSSYVMRSNVLQKIAVEAA